MSALRAPTGISVRIENIRTEIPVMVKDKSCAGFLYEIADFKRVVF